MPIHRSLAALLFALLILADAVAPAHAQPVNPPDRLLTDMLVGAPIAAGQYIFWKQRDANQLALYGYDLATGTRFLVAQPADALAALASDGAVVAWTVQRPPDRTLMIQSYDLQSHAVSTILSGIGGASEIALDRGILYYTDAAPAHRGLYARAIASGREQLISPAGRRPVAVGGALLWSEERSAGASRLATWSLHLRTPDGRYNGTALASQVAGYAGFSGYDVSGSAAVWAFAGGARDTGVQILRLDDGARATIARAGSDPHIQGSTVLWTEEPSGAPGQSQQSQVRSYELATGQATTLVAPGTAASAARAVAADRTVALTVARGASGASAELRLVGAQARGLRFDARPSTAGTPAATCDLALPGSCGQLRALADGTLADDGGRWTMRGVQFFLPQFGINGKSLWDENYAAALADGSLTFWLDRAQGYLRANLLRVFVDLPYTVAGTTTVITPTSYSTLHSFAAEANARGMRLGLVLHNSADWGMTEPRASWIAGLLDDFAARGSLPMLAYLSADNEINNHCANSGQDCFDAGPGFDARAYIDGALEWVAQFRAVVKRRAPQLLITAGISSEMIDADLTRAAFDFFRPDSQGRNLAGLVDLLAPHNYSGGATAIVKDLRVGAAYRGAVVLEEFGFPTDPRPRDPSWTEGPQQCWPNPLLAECAASAPFFVETNLQALRIGGYAGGSAWMLADMHEKDTATACGDPKKSFALWTGLFAIGGTYCDGGTTSRGAGQPKATALRVCIAYTGSFTACAAGTPFQVRRYLPLMR